MLEWLAPYNVEILQVFVVVVLVCLMVLLFVLTVRFILKSYLKLRETYEQYEQKRDNSPRKKKKTTNYVITSLIVVFVAAVLFIALAIIANKKYGLSISSDHVVITFTGIIATFIVVTNYAQVLEIKKEMNDKIRQLDRSIKNNASKGVLKSEEAKKDR